MATKVSDIRVYRYGQWHTLVNSRVFDGTAWRIFKQGDGVFYKGEWYVVSQAVSVYISPTVAENKDGELYWFFTISTDPDIISTYDSEVTIDGSVTMSDTGAYNVSVTANGDEWSVNTGIPYVEGVTIERTDLTATFSNTSYIVGEVTFTGVFSLRRSMSEDEEEELEETEIEEENEENTELSEEQQSL